MTKSERILWNIVLRGRKTGYKFLRQKPIHRFILDFYCRDLLLAIEIDGGYHVERKIVDQARDRFLSNLNIETIRISADVIENDLESIKLKILNYIKTRKVSLFKGKAPEWKEF
jgi:very-short-patch-repair endonuclease